MENSRTKNAVFNVGGNFVLQFIKLFLNFICRTVFIYFLGKDALGLNGLYTDVLAMLSLAELGIGSAINFSLYKPIAQKDYEKISVLMSFYKKAYRVIGLIVLTIGIVLIPFLQFFIKDIQGIQDAYIIYLLFLFNTVSSYFLAYKETLISADQKNYKLTSIQIVFLFIMYLLQIIGVITTKSFIVYLVIQILVQFIQRIYINRYISKIYDKVKFNRKEHLPKEDSAVIKKNVKAMLYHKIGDYSVHSTDNLLISYFIDVGTVGIYSNYLMIVNIVTSILMMVFNNVISGFGNLLAIENESKKKIEDVYNLADFIGMAFASFITILFICLLNRFIVIWVGDEFCLPVVTTVLISVVFYMATMRIAPSTIKTSAGLYDVDKYTSLIQAVLNIVFSIIFYQFIGLSGIILGTIVSGLLPSIQRPYLVYKYILGKSYMKYIKKVLINILFIVISVLIIDLINSFIKIDNSYLNFIIITITDVVVCSTFFILMYKNLDEYKNLKIKIIDILRKIKGKRNKNENN